MKESKSAKPDLDDDDGIMRLTMKLDPLLFVPRNVGQIGKNEQYFTICAIFNNVTVQKQRIFFFFKFIKYLLPFF
jgi:hypothetical protein